MTAPPDSRPGITGGSAPAGAADRLSLGPADLLDAADLKTVGEAARWAPSIHNSQPWRLRRLVDGIGVVDDISRSVPVIDPTGRDRTISCGSALFNAAVALRALGYATRSTLVPDPADPALVGTVHAVGRTGPADQDVVLHRMIPLRHTHRRVYRSHLVAEEDLLDLRQAVAAEGARLSVAEPSARKRLAQLLRMAVQAQSEDPELREEVERWVRRGGHPASLVDGIPSSALGTSPFPVDSLVHGGTRGIPGADEVEAELARSTVLVVSTREDNRHDWVIAGLALERLLLTATAKGLVATFAEQALQNPTVRPQVAEVLDIWGHPQVLLRVGRPLVDAPVTPRRPLTELFE
jgi:nitroreductase